MISWTYNWGPENFIRRTAGTVYTEIISVFNRIFMNVVLGPVVFTISGLVCDFSSIVLTPRQKFEFPDQKSQQYQYCTHGHTYDDVFVDLV